MEEKIVKQIAINWKSSGIQVFLATALSYTMAYCFELGYLARYKIDSSVISISVQQLFVTALVLLIVIVVADLLLAIAKATARWAKSDGVFARASLLLTVLTVLAAIFIILCLTDAIHVNYPRITYPVILMIYILFILLAFSRALYLGHKHGNYREGLEQAYKETDEARLKTQAKYVMRPQILELTIIPRVLIPLLIIIALGLSYSGFGYLFADYHNRDMTVVSRSDSKIEFVVSQFGENIITKNYDVRSHTLDNGYSIRQAVNHRYAREIITCTADFKKQDPSKNPAVMRCPK